MKQSSAGDIGVTDIPSSDLMHPHPTAESPGCSQPPSLGRTTVCRELSSPGLCPDATQVKGCLRLRPQVLPRVRTTLQGRPAEASIVATLLVCTVVTPGFLPESSPHMPTVCNPHARPCFQGATEHRNCLDRRFWERRVLPREKTQCECSSYEPREAEEEPP